MKDSVLDYEMKDNAEFGLYVGTYKKYNEGSLYGMWLDLEQFSDAEEFFKVCSKLHDDEHDAEFMFQDFKGFPEEFYNESMGEEEIQKILDYIALDDEDRELIEDYCEVNYENIKDFDEFIEGAKERSMGRYDSFREFTDQMADEEIACHSLGSSTEFFEEYFDYDKWEDELEGYYEIGSNGYVFNTSY